MVFKAVLSYAYAYQCCYERSSEALLLALITALESDCFLDRHERRSSRCRFHSRRKGHRDEHLGFPASEGKLLGDSATY